MAPFCISITGADDRTDPQQLVALSKRFPFVEWAVLVYPENVGAARNPSDEWRRKFLKLSTTHSLKTALHLCGDDIFRAILDDRLDFDQVSELVGYGRIQVNLNAREGHFTNDDVYRVYGYLAGLGCSLILQRHAGTEAVISRYLAEHPAAVTVGKVTVLFDTSRGRGFAPLGVASPAQRPWHSRHRWLRGGHLTGEHRVSLARHGVRWAAWPVLARHGDRGAHG